MSIWNKIHLKSCDITLLETDAIVNAANNSLLGGAGVDGAIHKAAGPELLEECKTLNGCKTGEAKITGGYNLKAKHVIHTVGPVFKNQGDEPQILADCYKNILELVVQNGLKSVAFPSISTGAYGYPIEKASYIALNTTYKMLEKMPEIEEVIFVLFSDYDLSVYEANLENLS